LSEALWHAAFHAVSAFCNAGFSTFSNSLEGCSGHSGVLIPTAILITVGGIGFLTLEELDARRRTRHTRDRFRLSLHSRIVLVATGLLITGGAVAFALLEWGGVLSAMTIGHKLQNALFMSVTARTAGFSTVPYAEAQDATNFLTVILMFIGGSPGSTAGVLKTTTIFIIGLLAWSRIRGNLSVSVWSRTIPDETVQRATGVFVLVAGILAGGVFAMTLLQRSAPQGDPFLWILFETVSAFNTVGLKLGETPRLEPASRVLTTVLMFIGRIGPVSFAAALAMRTQARSLRYAYAREDFPIG
jgi:trk system potassium uptake protein